jgi:hypothetical protein
MIGFNFLGKMGQLGNQMFQYAALKGIARNNGYNFCIPNHKEILVDGLGNKLRIELFEPFVLKNLNTLNLQIIDESRPVVQETGFEFDETLFNTCPEWVTLCGYFQTEKYFKHIQNEIREDFTFKNEILKPCKEMISQVYDPISLHIRRGDFLINSDNHHNLGLDYYESALKNFDFDRTVIVFSDDTEWCKQQELFSSDRFLVSESNNSYVDMCLMTLCREHIIANSTFSWWGAWLSNPKKVIAPKTWFGPNNAHLITKDIIPEDWTVI